MRIVSLVKIKTSCFRLCCMSKFENVRAPRTHAQSKQHAVVGCVCAPEVYSNLCEFHGFHLVVVSKIVLSLKPILVYVPPVPSLNYSTVFGRADVTLSSQWENIQLSRATQERVSRE